MGTTERRVIRVALHAFIHALAHAYRAQSGDNLWHGVVWVILLRWGEHLAVERLQNVIVVRADKPA
eukprot:CAMPEP_0170470850 /NCGR_PEP_ID=MMETSP0123-20130129/13206_1 /TAXON_ID=182087 /ORGANISM="Favella ehrenbergii, Strain Fehren 1" /LENGTH=65 /DNA_ID=CAMNT_0010738183 /DNA_START=34 /DNA_END=231 /DNA_ORIENTATION=-